MSKPLTAQKIGFVGLGGMGRGLVKNLLTNGYSVRVFDLDPDAVRHVIELGADAAENAVDAARDADFYAVCVTTAEAVRSIALGASGALAVMKPDATFIDHTTVSPCHVDQMRAACAEAGIAYAEAPITRTPAHAERGEVNVLFGGEEDQLRALKPLFDSYAENIFHVGPAGHAIRLKLIHNYIAFANVAAWCEGFALAAREGLDMSKVIGIISAAGGKSGMMDLYGEQTLKRDFTPHMSLANAQKDVRYYARWLEDAGLPGFMADAVHQTYALASITGDDSENCTAVIKAYERITGVEARLNDGAR
jgi:3-hydroxyisobutyrate dehydrogenase-like beta-hydroxyacid dehydrogenase